MEITIKVNNTTRRFKGSYDELHNHNWDIVLQDMLDTEHDTTTA